MAGGLMIAALVALQVAGLSAPPPRDTTTHTPLGTGAIRGRVLAADTGRPMPRAVVQLSGPQQHRNALTDAEGRYAFNDLPAGAYTVTANGGQHRAAYLSISYGAIRPDGSFDNAASRPRQIKLDPGQRRDDIDIRLEPAAAISGTVVDSSGEPVARISVRAMRMHRDQRPSNTGMAMTDDLGQYRIFGLAPGEYVVYADSRNGELPREVAGEPMGFGPTYAPATGLLVQAARLRLGMGSQASIDLQLIETRLFSITGTVATSTGDPPRNSSVMVVRADIDMDGPIYGAAVSPSGTFTVSSLPPGAYDLHVRHHAEPTNPATLEHTMARVEVSGDVIGVALLTSPGATVSGEILFDDGIVEGRKTSLSVQSAERRMFGPSPAIEVKDSTFTLKAVFSPVVIRGSVSGAGEWALRAVLLDGRDITDTPTMFSARDRGRLQVVFTGRAPVLEGTLVDSGSLDPEDCLIVVFNEDPATWTPHSTSIRLVRVGSKRKFVLRGLREGRYRVAAIPSEVGLPLNPPDVELLEQLKKVGIPVVLNLGETRLVDVGLVSVER